MNTENNFELKLERLVEAPPDQMWKCWTEPQHLVHWFTPRPWQTVEARCDLKIGGEFYNLMKSPEGEEHANHGVYLEIIPNQKLVWTNAFKSGWYPNEAAQPMLIVVELLFHEAGSGRTNYKATARHWSMAAVKQHEEMGFYEGWNQALEQLLEYTRTGKIDV